MPRDVLQNTPEPEIKRQEAIHEIIYTEEDYVRDLNLLEEVKDEGSKIGKTSSNKV